MSTKDEDNRYDVSDRYATRAKPAATPLPLATPAGVRQEPARRAVTLAIPTPALDRGRAGKRELKHYVDRLDHGVEVAGAIARFNGAQQRLEETTQTLEQTFARGTVELRKLEGRLRYEEEMLSLQYAQHLTELRQAVVDEERRGELADTQFAIVQARKTAELAKAREEARAAQVIAERKAAAAAAEAAAEELRKETEVETARRKVNEARERRRQGELHDDEGDAKSGSPHLTAALRNQTERWKIKRDAEAQRRAVHERAGASISDDDRDELDTITEAEQEALKQFDINAAGIRFAPDEESA